MTDHKDPFIKKDSINNESSKNDSLGLSKKDMILYGIPQFLSMMWIYFSKFWLSFYYLHTTHLKPLDLSITSTVFIGITIIIIPIFGNSLYGKRSFIRKMIFFIAPLWSICIIPTVLFPDPNKYGEFWVSLWINGFLSICTAISLLFETGYTAFGLSLSSSYSSLKEHSFSGSKYTDSITLFSIYNAFGMLGRLCGIALPSYIKASSFPIFVYFISALSLIVRIFVLSYFLRREERLVNNLNSFENTGNSEPTIISKSKPLLPIIPSLYRAWRVKPARIVLAASLLVASPFLIPAAPVYLHYAKSLNNFQIGYIQITGSISGVLGAKFWHWFSKRFGKKLTFQAATMGWALSLISTLFLNVIIVVNISVFCALGSLFLIQPLIKDVIEYDSFMWADVDRKETLYTSLFIETKLGDYFYSTIIGGFALYLIGFDSNSEFQNPSVMKNMTYLVVLQAMPLFLSVFIMFYYPLTERVHREISALSEKRYTGSKDVYNPAFKRVILPSGTFLNKSSSHSLYDHFSLNELRIILKNGYNRIQALFIFLIVIFAFGMIAFISFPFIFGIENPWNDIIFILIFVFCILLILYSKKLLILKTQIGKSSPVEIKTHIEYIYDIINGVGTQKIKRRATNPSESSKLLGGRSAARHYALYSGNENENLSKTS